MKISRWKKCSLLLFLMIPLGIFSSPISINAEIQANTAVFWTPLKAEVGDVVTIQYNTTAGSLSSDISTLYLQWGFDLYGNFKTDALGNILDELNPVLPSKVWYTPNSVKGFNGFFLASPMTNVSDEIWEINITMQDDLPDRIRIYFSVNANGLDPRHGSSNSPWYIDPRFSTDGIFIIDPSVAETNFFTKADDLVITVRGNSTATGWEIALKGRTPQPLTCTVTDSTYDATSGLWTVKGSFPSTIDVGVYDLQVSASVAGITRVDTEANAVQILDSFKDSYTRALIGDQEMNWNSYPPDGILHGNHNLSDLLQELAIVNPDILVNLGSVTYWGDIETMEQYATYIEAFYDLPHVYVASHRDRFIGNEADWPYTGAGMGALEKIVGIRHKQWTYGDHYYISIYTGDHRMEQYELDWYSDTTASASGDTRFLMIHDPIGYETTYNPTAQNAIDESGRAALAPLISSSKMDYYIHSSAGVEGSQQVSQTGAFHIGTKSAAFGYYLLTVSDDEITEWRYNETIGYYPWYQVDVAYSGTNDGTEESGSATITNDLAVGLDAARVVFKMKSGSDYEVDVGTIFSQYESGNIKYVEVHVPVSASASQIVQISKAIPTTTTTTETTTTTGDGTPGFEVFFGFFALIPIVYRKRKR